jgi:hypothetical protein
MPSRHKPLIIAAQVLVLLAGIYLSASGRLDTALQTLGLDRMTRANDLYLQNSMNKALDGFLILSAIKSGLAIIEGSEIGIGFNLQLGDIVQSAYDYVDIAWKTALAGGTVILLTRLLVQATAVIDHWCLAAALCAGLVLLLFSRAFPNRHRPRRLLKDGTFFLVVCTAVGYVVLPISITGAAFLSEKITGPLIEESQRSFDGLKAEFSPEQIGRRFLAEPPEPAKKWAFDFSFREKIDSGKAYLQEQTTFVKEKTKNIAAWTLQLIAGYLFDSIVFPVTFFLLLFVLVKGALIYFFEDRRQQLLRDDVAAVIRRLSPADRRAAKFTTVRRRPERYRRYSRRGKTRYQSIVMTNSHD